MSQLGIFVGLDTYSIRFMPHGFDSVLNRCECQLVLTALKVQRGQQTLDLSKVAVFLPGKPLQRRETPLIMRLGLVELALQLTDASDRKFQHFDHDLASHRQFHQSFRSRF